jgi:hypothetical protein
MHAMLCVAGCGGSALAHAAAQAQIANLSLNQLGGQVHVVAFRVGQRHTHQLQRVSTQGTEEWPDQRACSSVIFMSGKWRRSVLHTDPIK